MTESIPRIPEALGSIHSAEGRTEGKKAGSEKFKTGQGKAKDSRFQIYQSKEVVWEGLEKRARLGKWMGEEMSHLLPSVFAPPVDDRLCKKKSTLMSVFGSCSNPRRQRQL